MLWGIKNVFASGTIYVDGIAIGVPSDRFNRPNSMVEGRKYHFRYFYWDTKPTRQYGSNLFEW